MLILRKDQLNNKNPLKIDSGVAFRVDLDSNPTTGYAWEIKACSWIKTNEGWGEPAPTVGGSIDQRFTFVTGRKGLTTIIFEYQRPWEDEPIEKLELLLEVI